MLAMKNELKFLAGWFLFLISVFNLYRILFIISNARDADDAPWAFYYGIGLDISIASYCLLFPLFVFAIAPFSSWMKRNKNRVLFGYTIVVFTLISLIEVAGIPLFKEWGTTLNSRGLGYLRYTNEAMVSIGNSGTLIYFGLLFIVLFSGVRFLKQLNQLAAQPPLNTLRRYPVFFAITALLVVGLRGGVQGLPISVSSAFFSKNPQSNFAAVNKTFYLFYDLTKKYDYSAIKGKYSESELDDFYNETFKPVVATDHEEIITLEKPNIVLILLEGWPAKIIEPDLGCTPHFAKLREEGLYFDQVYASGFRTDQGLLSILSGVPALPGLNILSDVNLVKQFPSVVQTYNETGYHTLFFYGGSLDFSNLKNYFYHNATQTLVGKSDFPANERSLSWGVPDHLVFKKVVSTFNQTRQPFFATILTLCSHPPFDFPGEKKFGSDTVEDKFKNTVHYLDKSIHDFMEQSKKTEWFDNTLFLFVADHGSVYLEDIDFDDHERFHIPFLVYGKPLNEALHGKTLHYIANHHDIPATLLALSGIENTQFPFSQNIFQKSVPAFWIKDTTMGWLTSENSLIVNYEKDEFFDDKKYRGSEAEKSDAMKFYSLVVNYVLKNKQLQPPEN